LGKASGVQGELASYFGSKLLISERKLLFSDWPAFEPNRVRFESGRGLAGIDYDIACHPHRSIYMPCQILHGTCNASPIGFFAMADTEQPNVAALTVQLLSAYLANNTVAHSDIADLVRATKAALLEEKPLEPVEAAAPIHTPAVTARRSLASPDHILSLIDGKPYKTLKRHLSSHGLTPESYRQRYNLPFNYPMVAPGFAAERRAIAEKIGLGRRIAVARPDKTSELSPPPSEVAPVDPTEVQARVKPTPAKKKPAADAAAISRKASETKVPVQAPRAKSAKRPAVAADVVKAEPVHTNVLADKPRTGRRTLNLFKPLMAEAEATKPETAPKAALKKFPRGKVAAPSA
jgi:predicted transcriptional regulator